jgi:spore coat protein U-like protein
MRALILLSALLAVTPAVAQTPTTPGFRCTVRSTGLNFGPYSALDRAANTASTVIEVACPTSGEVAAVRILLSPGRSGQPLDRTMTRGRDDLRYNVYTEPSYHRVAGDGSNGTVAPIRLVRGPGHATFRLYGKVFPGQSVRDGEYDDTLRVTVEF